MRPDALRPWWPRTIRPEAIFDRRDMTTSGHRLRTCMITGDADETTLLRQVERARQARGPRAHEHDVELHFVTLDSSHRGRLSSLALRGNFVIGCDVAAVSFASSAPYPTRGPAINAGRAV